MKNISAVKNIIELASADIGFVHGGKAVCLCYGKKGLSKVVRSFKEDATKDFQANEKKCRKECHARHYHFLDYSGDKYLVVETSSSSSGSDYEKENHGDDYDSKGVGDF